MSTFIAGSEAYPTIAAAMAPAIGGDTIQLMSGYGSEAATVNLQNLLFTGDASSTNVVLTLGSGIGNLRLGGLAPINVNDNAGNNTITGNGGANLFHVMAGNDVIHGGGGVDRLVIDYSAVTSTITGTVTSVTDGATHSVLFDGVENFTITTGAGNDTITTANGDNLISTAGGDDTITVGNGHDNIMAGLGNDTVSAGDGGDFVDGGEGNNTITTGLGQDTVLTGAGNDTIITGGGADLTTVAGGVDTVNSGDGNDLLTVNYANSTTDVTGSMSSGSFAIGYSGVVADVAGNSVTFQNTESFNITTGSGNDTITTGDRNDTITGGAGNDILSGGGGSDTIRGNQGSDIIHGGAGNDVLFGGQGADHIFGDQGSDVMTGGENNDTFVFDSLTASFNGAPDLITDFSPGDRIDLSAIDADTSVGGDQAFHVGGGGGHAGDIVATYDAGNDRTVLSLYVDNNGSVDSTIWLTGNHVGIAAGDFIL